MSVPLAFIGVGFYLFVDGLHSSTSPGWLTATDSTPTTYSITLNGADLDYLAPGPYTFRLADELFGGADSISGDVGFRLYDWWIEAASNLSGAALDDRVRFT